VTAVGADGFDADRGIAKVTVVGSGILGTPGVCARIFEALANQSINIRMISTGEIRVTCIIDRGRDALLPLIDEIAANLSKHKLLIATGAGIRARHVFSVGLDLGLPTGALAVLAGIDAEMNAHIIGALLAKYGVGIILPAANINQILPVLLQVGNAVIFNGVPPYHETRAYVASIRASYERSLRGY